MSILCMQRVFKIWLIAIFFLALIAVFLVDISSPLFGFLLLPLIIIVGIIIILGYYTERK